MNARWFFSSALCALFALSTSATNSVAQDYVAGVISFGGSATLNASTTTAVTRYLATIDGNLTTTTDVWRIVIPRKGVLKKLYWSIAPASTLSSGTGHYVEVLVNGSSTVPPFRATWSGATKYGSNSSAAVPVDSGNTVSVRLQLAAASAGGAISRPTVSFEFLVAGTVGSQWSSIGADINYTAGKVGIGTTAPGRELEVAGTVQADTIQASGGFRFPDGSTQVTAYEPGGGGIPASMLFADANGNIGLGTTSPGEKLTVTESSDIAVQMAIPTGVTATPGTSSGSLLTSDTYYFSIVAEDGAGGTTAGSLVISYPVPATRSIHLDWAPVRGANLYRVYIATSPGGPYRYRTSATDAFDYVSVDPSEIADPVPPVTTAYVNKLSAEEPSWILGGNVGIGTTSPGAKLEIYDPDVSGAENILLRLHHQGTPNDFGGAAIQFTGNTDGTGGADEVARIQSENMPGEGALRFHVG